MKGRYPDLYRGIQNLPWVMDETTESERETVDNLIYLSLGDVDLLKSVLSLPWLQDDITAAESVVIDSMYGLSYEEVSLAAAIIAIPWMQDGITEIESDVIRHLDGIAYYNKEAVASIVTMPFLASLEEDDLLAIRGIYELAGNETENLLEALMDHPTIGGGITDSHTTLVAAAGTIWDPVEISRILSPGLAHVEVVSSQTHLTPNLKISIVRTDTPPQPRTTEIVREAVAFSEEIMQLPLPVGHVIFVLNDKSGTKGYGGANHGYAFSYKPGHEQYTDNYIGHTFQSAIVHETAHYYWRLDPDWVDEGVANTFEYLYGLKDETTPGFLQVAQREDCEAHDLEMLTEWNPRAESEAKFHCNYFLGQMLFHELLQSLDTEEFYAGLRELYSLSLAATDTDETPSIVEVRQAFQDQADIVEKHWSGKLNAPENRPFDEGIYRVSHDLIQWDQYPTYDGDSVTFRGTLLGDAVLSNETLHDATKGGSYQNFTLGLADEFQFLGVIFPPLGDELYWPLDDPGDTNALDYQLEDYSFTIRFRLRQGLRDPSNYVVIVWGYRDETRMPFIAENIDILGYARIRVP